jgi:hypothetical protein
VSASQLLIPSGKPDEMPSLSCKPLRSTEPYERHPHLHADRVQAHTVDSRLGRCTATAVCRGRAELSALGQFSGRERSQHVEFVAVRVGHDHPADLALADADPARAERFQPGDLGGLVARP